MKVFTKSTITSLCFVLFLLSMSFTLNAQDTDGDGIVDTEDLDDDNDGIPDNTENACQRVFNFNVSSEGWYSINNNNNLEVWSDPASHSTCLLYTSPSPRDA